LDFLGFLNNPTNLGFPKPFPDLLVPHLVVKFSLHQQLSRLLYIFLRFWQKWKKCWDWLTGVEWRETRNL